MFPHACGEDMEYAVANGANPDTVVPDEYVVVRGGTTPLPDPGDLYSGAVGPALNDAAAAVPHGQIRVSTVGAIRAAGGVVTWLPETSRSLTTNHQHVNITEAGPSVLSDLTPNPVPRLYRIDGNQP